MSTTTSTYATPMGKIVTQLTITNRADEIRAASGTIAADAVRSVTLDNVLVDTGATTLCLPRDVIDRLGLDPAREARVSTAAGIRRARMFQDAKVSLLGREATFECLELPRGTTPLLGVIPLELLGIEPDVRTQRLRVLPENADETYLTIL